MPDNAPAGTVLATVKVTMSRSDAPFTGRLVSSNPLYTFRHMNVVGIVTETASGVSGG